MDIREYIDALFSSYEETNSLIDFKEELESNLMERINSLKKKGLGQEEAYEKATVELGDVSDLADELSMKKKQEVFSEMYMSTRSYIKPWRMAIYVIFGAGIGFGVIIGIAAWLFSKDIQALLGSLLVFSEVSSLGLIYLGLTQETAGRDAMPWKRALWYVVASGFFIFGIIVFVMTYYAKGAGLPHAVSTLMVFALPGLALGVFLLLTEKDRSKPWVAELRKKELERALHRFGSPGQQERFGLISGAIWIGGISLFVLLTLLIGIKFSWCALAAALVGQMLLVAAFSTREV